ncbi:hypothetical protein J437_LFUL019498, partial [Ladona fulva]
MAGRKGESYTNNDIESALFESDSFSSSTDEDSTDEIDGMDSVRSETSCEEGGEDEVEHQPLQKRKKVDCWKWCNSNASVKKFDFCGVPGINARVLRNLPNNANERDFFYAFVKPDFWESISEETNRFAESFLNETGSRKSNLTDEWFSTTAEEIQAYFAVCILMAQVKKNKIHKYWSPRAVTETPFFGKVMPYRRFLLLSKFLHFTDNANLDEKVPLEVPSSEAIVLQLMKPYFRLGYTLAVDNWYTSPALFQKLIDKKTNAIGTVRQNRKNMPKHFQKMALKKGETKVMFCHGIAAFKWRDKKD